MDRVQILEAQVRRLEEQVEGAAVQIGRRDALIEQLRRRPTGRAQVGWAHHSEGQWWFAGLSTEPPEGEWVRTWIDIADLPAG